jgi:DNA-binding beta-propeller fold protein YncE
MKTFMIARLLIATLMSVPVYAQERGVAAPLAFQGRMLVSISDADMLASAYVNGKLGPREGVDALSVIPLDTHPRDAKAHTVNVSNSVAGPPVAVGVSPDGRFAIVVETFLPRPTEGGAEHTFRDLKPGNKATVVDLSKPSHPQIVQTLQVAERPDSVSFNSDGSVVALSINPQGAGKQMPLVLLPFRDGRLGPAVAPSIPGWTMGDRLIHSEFHPRENLLALVNETKAELSFVKVVGSGSGLRTETFGNVVKIEKAPYMARFTPDGRHVIVNALYWGPDVQGTWTEAPRGSVVSVRLSAGQALDGSPRHALVSRALTGVSPEGLAISPDGRLAVTTNLERSYLPFDDPRITWYSSVTLLTLDPQSGTLTRIADYAYDGILPEAAAFDASSQFLAVATYDHFNDRRPGGSVDFWRVARDQLDPNRIELVKTEHSVSVARGVHSLVLVR